MGVRYGVTIVILISDSHSATVIDTFSLRRTFVLSSVLSFSLKFQIVLFCFADRETISIDVAKAKLANLPVYTFLDECKYT